MRIGGWGIEKNKRKLHRLDSSRLYILEILMTDEMKNKSGSTRWEVGKFWKFPKPRWNITEFYFDILLSAVGGLELEPSAWAGRGTDKTGIRLSHPSGPHSAGSLTARWLGHLSIGCDISDPPIQFERVERYFLICFMVQKNF